MKKYHFIQLPPRPKSPISFITNEGANLDVNTETCPTVSHQDNLSLTRLNPSANAVSLLMTFLKLILWLNLLMRLNVFKPGQNQKFEWGKEATFSYKKEKK
jgi:hypothetical protein